MKARLHSAGRGAVKALRRLGGALEAWRDGGRIAVSVAPEGHEVLAQRSLRELLGDVAIPEGVRRALAGEFAELQELLERLEQGTLHIALFGRVSVGKSALVNALLGEERFAVSPLHGETKAVQGATWEAAGHGVEGGGVVLLDTPGIQEAGGEAREELALSTARRSDLILFVADGDITEMELTALRRLGRAQRPMLLLLNKADRYSGQEREAILAQLRRRVAGVLPPERVVPCAARPGERIYVEQDPATGLERESRRQPPPDVMVVREWLWRILETEGKTLTALNASLFAGEVSDRVAERMVALRRDLAERVVRAYCLGKGVGVALNPVPVADLLAVAADGVMIVHLGRIYGLPVTRAEAGGVFRVIAAQMMLLMGAVWGVQLAASALKGMSHGLSTLITAGAQGAVAYYGAYVVGKAAERYFAQGRSWGAGGPKQAVREILDSLDPDSILTGAREEILARLKQGGGKV